MWKAFLSLSSGAAILAGLLAVAPSAAAQALDIGVIKTVTGGVTVVRGQNGIPATPGMIVLVKDSLVTGKDGSVGVVLKDDSTVSLGPDSEISFQDFQFSPGEGRLSWVSRFVRGTAVFLTGIIGKLSPQSVRVETPVATVGIRGTRFAIKVGE
jgi:hypothetical protein